MKTYKLEPTQRELCRTRLSEADLDRFSTRGRTTVEWKDSGIAVILVPGEKLNFLYHQTVVRFMLHTSEESWSEYDFITSEAITADAEHLQESLKMMIEAGKKMVELVNGGWTIRESVRDGFYVAKPGFNFHHLSGKKVAYLNKTKRQVWGGNPTKKLRRLLKELEALQNVDGLYPKNSIIRPK